MTQTDPKASAVQAALAEHPWPAFIDETTRRIVPSASLTRTTRAFLSALDAAGPPIYIQPLFFYDVKDKPWLKGLEWNDVVDGLASSLEAALEMKWLCLAGRLRASPARGGDSGSRRQRLEVEYSAQNIVGSDLISCRVDLSLRSLSDHGYDPRRIPLQLHPRPGLARDHDFALGDPLVVLKLTRFSCGSFVIAASISHIVVDFKGAMAFLRDVLRGEREIDTRPSALGDRRLLRWIAQEDQSTVEEEREVRTRFRKRPSYEEFQAFSVPSATRLFHLSKAQLSALKASVQEDAGWISTHDALCATVLKAFLEARKDDRELMERSTFQFMSVFDARSRLTDGAFEGYCGNMSHGLSIDSRPREILEMPVASLARALRALKTRETESRIRALHVFLEDPSVDPVDLWYSIDILQGGAILESNLIGTEGVYELSLSVGRDAASTGPPSKFSMGAVLPENSVFIYDSAPEVGGCDVMVGIRHDYVDALVQHLARWVELCR